MFSTARFRYDAFMTAPILGLHHVTATVDDAQDDLNLCVGTLGLRLVKTTVNFDNHHVYHFYYGDRHGTPGTIWTTFPYRNHGVRVGTRGAGQVVTTLFSEAAVGTLLSLVGLAVLGYFTAHPNLFTESSSLVVGADRLFPRYVMLGLPAGMTGVVIAAVLAAAMSSLSAGMNSSASVITEDFIARFRPTPLTDAERMKLARYISIAIGIVVIVLSLIVSHIPGNLFDLCYKAVNLVVAPLFILFFLAMFVPWATSFGALASVLTSLTTAVSIAFSDSLGLPTVSIMWIMPGSFAVGVLTGCLASLLPFGRTPVRPTP